MSITHHHKASIPAYRLHTRLFAIVVFLIIWVSCQKNPEPAPLPVTGYSRPGGVFVLNEGNFRMANGSVTYHYPADGALQQDIFSTANQRPTGDVIQDMKVMNGEAWIVANNSGRIEVVSLDNFFSLAGITGPASPRQLLQLSHEKAYVSDLYSSKIYILSIKGRKVTGWVETGKSAEAMVLAHGKVFALHWSALGGYDNRSLTVIDAVSDTIIKTLTLSKEPNSLALDHLGKLWVLCSGGFMHEEKPALYRINTQSLEIELKLEFTRNGDYPVRLCSNEGKDTLYFLNRDLYRMLPSDTRLPGDAFVQASGRLFYALGACHSGIYVSDALDYQQNGVIYVYDTKGNLLRSFTAGIIPGGFVFVND